MTQLCDRRRCVILHGMQSPRLRVACVGLRSHWLALAVLLGGCGAQDAGTYCEADHQCISNSCTWRTCDAFPDCWPSCGDDGVEAEPAPELPRPHDPRPPLDAGVCTLRLCSELSLDECIYEPGCLRIPACLADASAPSWTPPPLDAGSRFDAGSPRCGPVESCISPTSLDLRVHPLSQNACL